MEFCNKCDNIYYIEIDINGVLKYKCKKCKNVQDLNEINNKPYLIKTSIQEKKSSYDYIINEYTKYDNTLPRIKHIKCPKCTNILEEQKQEQEQKQSDDEEEQESQQEESSSFSTSNNSDFDDGDDDDDDDGLEDDGNDDDSSESFGGGGSNMSHENEVIFIRYDDINLKYIYLCCKCNYIWKL